MAFIKQDYNTGEIDNVDELVVVHNMGNYPEFVDVLNDVGSGLQPEDFTLTNDNANQFTLTFSEAFDGKYSACFSTIVISKLGQAYAININDTNDGVTASGIEI